MDKKENIRFLNLTLKDTMKVADRISEDETFLNIIEEAGYGAKKNNIKEFKGRIDIEYIEEIIDNLSEEEILKLLSLSDEELLKLLNNTEANNENNN